jgi:hypothetical protein
LTVVGVALLVVVAVSGLRLKESRASAIQATANLEKCRQLSAQIAALSERPVHASLGETASAIFVRRVEESASKAQIEPAKLMRIDPQPARRIGDTSYLEQPTFVDLKQVTLAQLVTFLEECTAGDTKLTVTALRLTAPRENLPTADSESWSVEVTLTQLVFSPQSERGS